MTPWDAITEVQGYLCMEPVYLVGSAVAAQIYDLPGWHDLDVFVPSEPILYTTVQTLLHRGYTLDERFDRVWWRWQRYGVKNWHTNSLRLHSPQDVETNVVFKKVDGHPTTSLAQVLESFDFGLLAMGYELETFQYRDLRPYLFPNNNLNRLPLIPGKREQWVRGFISQYNGVRQGMRYAKYYQYGHDMSLVKDDLVTGYMAAAGYHGAKFEDRDVLLSQIYLAIAEKIQSDQVGELLDSYLSMDFNDPLDEILEALT